MNNIFEKKVTARILSAILAIMLWLYVITVQNPVLPKDVTIPVKLINIDSLSQSGMTMMSDAGSFLITLRLKGNKDVLGKLNESVITATADLRGYNKKGINIIPVEVKGIPAGIDVRWLSEPNIKVELDRIVSAQLPVSVNLLGNPVQGMAALTPVINPTDVAIRGAESLVSTIKYIVADIDISSASREIKKNVPIKAVNAEGKEVLNVELNPKIVQVDVPIQNTKIVPITIDLEGEAAAGYKFIGASVIPQSVYIAGPNDTIESITSVKTEKIDISGLTGSITREVKLIVPDNIELANKSDKIMVRIDIDRITDKRVDIDNLEIRNLPDGLGIESIQKNLAVVIRGPESLVNNAPGNLSFYIDLKNIGEGSYDLPVQWEKPAQVEVLDVIPKNLNVVLKKVQ